jgi:hypothetical protein
MARIALLSKNKNADCKEGKKSTWYFKIGTR